MITVTHVSAFKKTFWSSYWFISHSIGLCPVAVRRYILGRKMEGGRIEALGCLFFCLLAGLEFPMYSKARVPLGDIILPFQYFRVFDE